MSWELTETYVTSYSVSGSSRIVRLRGTISPAAGSFSQSREKLEPQPLPLTAPRPSASSQGWYVNPPHVSLSVDGVEIARFSELVALDSRSKPPTVVLKRAKDNSMEMWAWHEAARMGDLAAARKSASLVVYGYNGAVARYHLENAWPSKIEIGSLKAGASEVLMETVTIVCEDLQRVAP